jgi:hypothetical protein
MLKSAKKNHFYCEENNKARKVNKNDRCQRAEVSIVI